MTQLIRTRDIAQPIVVELTANATRCDKDACIERGMNDYLRKPIRLETLVDLLKLHFPTSQSSRDLSAASRDSAA